MTDSDRDELSLHSPKLFSCFDYVKSFFRLFVLLSFVLTSFLDFFWNTQKKTDIFSRATLFPSFDSIVPFWTLSFHKAEVFFSRPLQFIQKLFGLRVVCRVEDVQSGATIVLMPNKMMKIHWIWLKMNCFACGEWLRTESVFPTKANVFRCSEF